MHKIEKYPAADHTRSLNNRYELNGVKLDSEVDEWIGIDQWISSAIEWKRSEVIKQQMTSHINKMKTRRFKFKYHI